MYVGIFCGPRASEVLGLQWKSWTGTTLVPHGTVFEGHKIAIPADSIARAIAYAIEQPADVEIDEIGVRPTVQEFCAIKPPRGSVVKDAPAL
jgi:hypothetical protein